MCRLPPVCRERAAQCARNPAAPTSGACCPPDGVVYKSSVFVSWRLGLGKSQIPTQLLACSQQDKGCEDATNQS